jgi:hypothetical protein
MPVNQWLGARKPMGHLFHGESDEFRLYKRVYNLPISNPGFKAGSSNTFPGRTGRLLRG